MIVTRRRETFCVMWCAGLTLCLTPIVLGDPDVCCPGPAFPDYGDGSDGDYTVPPDPDYITSDKEFRNLTVLAGATLDTRGHTVRVCGTLLNRGVITDSYTGGGGGPGGNHGVYDDLGKGHDPRNHGDCNHQPYCTDGQDGIDGDPPSSQQPGQNGRGGRGGGGGGGGGGAWWSLKLWDADGGDGAVGGNGGKGGGYVRIYAFRFDNLSPGLVHADGLPGTGGGPVPSDGCACSEGSTEVCGPEHCVDTVWPQTDASGGGGGGGGGGAGGNGGTVEIYYGVLVHEGTIRANGRAGAPGSDGDSGCCNQYGCVGAHGYGCPGGAPNGGHGGDGENEEGCSGDGTAGGSGANGANGMWSLTPLRPYCKIADQCYLDGGEDPENDCRQCSAAVSMTDWTNKPDGSPCDDGVYCNGADTCNGSGSCAQHAGDPCDCDLPDSDCTDCCNETEDDCTGNEPSGSPCGDPTDDDCTDPDTCDGAGTCLDNHEQDGTSCDDGLYCDGADACLGGICSRHAGYPCAGDEWCDDGTDVCVGHGDGDFEPDSDVDLADFAGFQVCFDLEIVSGSPCEPANMTGTGGEIDLGDYAAFNTAISGP